jgi:hypothetical protein
MEMQINCGRDLRTNMSKYPLLKIEKKFRQSSLKKSQDLNDLMATQ